MSVQLFIPDYTISLLVALPLAFLVTFAAGVAMERSVIRHLYTRPLETLLATFGISIALQQLAKNIFGTQARPLTAPDWLGGALQINDIIGISTIRLAIFVLALIFSWPAALHSEAHAFGARGARGHPKTPAWRPAWALIPTASIC